MRKRLFLLLITGSLALVVLMIPSIGGADPDLPPAPRHVHWLMSGSTYIAQVGPDFCDSANLRTAHDQFHNNVHRADAGSVGPAAPGLHTGAGPVIVARQCGFVPPPS